MKGNPPLNCYDRMYFSPKRNLLTKAQAKVVLLVAALILAGLILSLARCNFGSVAFWGVCAIATLHFLCTLCYFYATWCWTYRQTHMMLSPEGGGNWSTHMGTLVSLCPRFYARVMCADPEFMNEGRITIAKAAQAQGFKGTIMLKGHLYGKDENRQEKARILSERLPGWTISHSSLDQTLGGFYAWVLTRHRNAYLKRIKAKPKAPFSKDRRLGMIELKR